MCRAVLHREKNSSLISGKILVRLQTRVQLQYDLMSKGYKLHFKARSLKGFQGAESAYVNDVIDLCPVPLPHLAFKF